MTALLASLGLLALLDLIAVARWMHADSDGRPPGAGGPVGSMPRPVARPALEPPPRGPADQLLTNNLEESRWRATMTEHHERPDPWVASPVPSPSDHRLARLLRRWLEAARSDLAGLDELHQRRRLLDRPWEEELLHFAPDGHLHGHLTPPDTRRRSTTARGWCPCWARQQRQP